MPELPQDAYDAVIIGAGILEAMAQAAIIVFASAKKQDEESRPTLNYFGSVKASSLGMVVPGELLIIKVKSVKILPTGAFVSDVAFGGSGLQR